MQLTSLLFFCNDDSQVSTDEIKRIAHDASKLDDILVASIIPDHPPLTVGMAWTPEFVNQLCWRLKALGAPKVQRAH